MSFCLKLKKTQAANRFPRAEEVRIKAREKKQKLGIYFKREKQNEKAQEKKDSKKVSVILVLANSRGLWKKNRKGTNKTDEEREREREKKEKRERERNDKKKMYRITISVSFWKTQYFLNQFCFIFS